MSPGPSEAGTATDSCLQHPISLREKAEWISRGGHKINPVTLLVHHV